MFWTLDRYFLFCQKFRSFHRHSKKIVYVYLLPLLTYHPACLFHYFSSYFGICVYLLLLLTYRPACLFYYIPFQLPRHLIIYMLRYLSIIIYFIQRRIEHILSTVILASYIYIYMAQWLTNRYNLKWTAHQQDAYTTGLLRRPTCIYTDLRI